MIAVNLSEQVIQAFVDKLEKMGHEVPADLHEAVKYWLVCDGIEGVMWQWIIKPIPHSGYIERR